MSLRSAAAKVTGHTVDVQPSAAHVRVLVAGEVVAETDRAVLLRETGMPDRYYVPRADVRAEVLDPSERSTHCPFKGDASYVSVEAGGVRVQDAAWSYVEPIEAVAAIAGHLAFYATDTVTVEVNDAPA